MADNCRGGSAFEEALIKAVFLKQLLYDKSHPDHCRRIKVKHAWEGISAEVRKPVDTCKMRWRSLKDRFIKISRELKSGKSNGSGLREDVTWPYYNQLSFLRDDEESGPLTTGDLEMTCNSEQTSDHVVVAVPVISTSNSVSPPPIGCDTNISTPSTPSSPGKSPRLDIAMALEKLSEIFQSQQQQQQQSAVSNLNCSSSNAAFGLLVKAELDKLPEPEQDDARIEIMGLLKAKKRSKYLNGK